VSVRISNFMTNHVNEIFELYFVFLGGIGSVSLNFFFLL
jgi:hypothetical protein